MEVPPSPIKYSFPRLELRLSFLMGEGEGRIAGRGTGQWRESAESGPVETSVWVGSIL